MTLKYGTAALLFLASALSVPSFFAHAAGPAAPGSDEFCKAMMDRAAELWPHDQVEQCAPWRKRHLEQLQKAAQDCQAAHKNDLEHLNACDTLSAAADRFWEESEYVENNRDVPAETANPAVHP